MYRKTSVELTSLDLVNLISVAENRIKGSEFVLATEDHPMSRSLARESVAMWQGTIRRLQAGLAVIDAEVAAEREPKLVAFEGGYSSSVVAERSELDGFR